MGLRADKTGQRFGKLVVIKPIAVSGRETRWICRCDCGGSKTVQGGSLVSGKTRSCGCLMKGINQTHGQAKAKTSEYIAWKSARQRCHYRKHKDYSRYGGRGIKFLF